MHLPCTVRFLALATVFSSLSFTVAQVNDGLSVDSDCTDLTSAEDGVSLGQVCTEVVGDDVLMTINITGVGTSKDNCCLSSTHICNYPSAMSHNEGDGCRKSFTYDFQMSDLHDFECTDPCDLFQIDGHAQILCDLTLPEDQGEPGDPLKNEPGQVGDQVQYGAMFFVSMGCNKFANCGRDSLCPMWYCGQGVPDKCGDIDAAVGINCFCSRDIHNLPPNPDLQNLPPNPEMEDFCWVDTLCHRAPPCGPGGVCPGNLRCVPGSCCGMRPLCLQSCGDAAAEIAANPSAKAMHRTQDSDGKPIPSAAGSPV